MMTTSKKLLALVVGAVLMSASATPVVHAQVEKELIWVQEPIDQRLTNGNILQYTYWAWSINNVGKVALMGSIGDPPTVFNETILTDVAGNMEAIANDGDSLVDGFGTVRLNVGNFPRLLDDGSVLFLNQFELSGSAVTHDNNYALLRTSGGGISTVLREGDPTPGIPGAVFEANFEWNNPNDWSVNGAGQIAMYSRVRGIGIDTTNDTGIWVNQDGAFDLFAREGDLLQGEVLGPVGRPRINASGQIMFLSGPPVIALQDTLWLGSGTAIHRIAQEGMPAPAVDDAVIDSIMSSVNYGPQLDGLGQVAFLTRLSGDKVTPDNNFALYLWDGSQLHLVAREGDTPPDGDLVFGISSNTPFSLAGPGSVIFYDGRGTTYERLWHRDSTGAVTSIIKDGDPAPGVPGATIEYLHQYAFANADGEVVTVARLAGPGLDDSNNRCVLAIDQAGKAHLVMRTGEQFEIAPGNWRTAEYPLLQAHGYWHMRALNDAGTYLFWMQFDTVEYPNGYSAWGAYFRATIPEPCPPDFNGDGVTNLDDLQLLLFNFGATTARPWTGDTDNDRNVDLDDLQALLGAFGTSCP